jgi:hypothetical protein
MKNLMNKNFKQVKENFLIIEKEKSITLKKVLDYIYI